LQGIEISKKLFEGIIQRKIDENVSLNVLHRFVIKFGVELMTV
jgi:hypothetical protein